MTNLKLTLLLLLVPSIAFADGEAAIVPYFIQLVSFIVFIAFIALIKFRLSGKFLLTAVYLATVFSTFYWVMPDTYGDYLHNMTTINSAIAVMPPFVVMLAFFILNKSYTRHRP